MAWATGGARSLVGSRRGRLALLVVLCALPAALEAGVVQYAGHLTATTYISPQAGALWPYDTFHDVRWVLVYHRSWGGFAGETVAAILLRGVFCTVLIALAWPAQTPRPSLRRLTARNLAFAAALGAFLSPWAVMSVVVADVSVAWFQFGEIVPVLILAPFLQRGAIVPNWWRGVPPAGTVVLSILNFLTLTAGSALVAAVPDGWRVAFAALTGGANGLLWLWAVRIAVLNRRVRWQRAPAIPILVAVVVSLMFTIGSVAGVRAGRTPDREPPVLAQVEGRAVDQPVIYLAGYESRYDGQPGGSSLPVVRYSYRGLHPDGRPQPYAPLDTHQSLVTSAHLLAAQVDHLHRSTGKKVSLLAVSEGTLVTRYYLKTMPHDAVDSVVLLSPVLRAGRVYYPPRDRSTGWGIATGWQLRGIFAAIGVGNPLPNSADEPFIRSILDNAPLFRGNELLCPVNGIRMVAFLPTNDAIANPPGLDAHIPVVHVAGFHGQLIDHPVTQRQLIEFLVNGHPPPHDRQWLYPAVQNAGAAWQAPTLGVRLNPVWRDVAGHPTRGYPDNACLGR